MGLKEEKYIFFVFTICHINLRVFSLFTTRITLTPAFVCVCSAVSALKQFQEGIKKAYFEKWQLEMQVRMTEIRRRVNESAMRTSSGHRTHSPSSQSLDCTSRSLYTTVRKDDDTWRAFETHRYLVFFSLFTSIFALGNS